MKDKLGAFLKYFIAFVLIVLSGYYTARDIDFNKLWSIIVNANYIWVIAPIPVMLASHWVRAMRWRTMLEPVKKTHSTWNLFSAVMVGYAMNNVIPRGGEFLRPYVYSRREKISFTSVFATIIVERVIDLITLILLFAGVFFFFREQIRQAMPNMHIEKILVPTMLLIVLLLLCFYPPIINFFLKIFIKPLSLKLYNKINSLFVKFIKGFEVIKTPSRYARLILESWAIWLLYTIPLYMMFFSFGFQARLHLGFDDAILLIVVSGIGVTIAPTPGAIGVYHYLIKSTLVNLYGISPDEAFAYATVTHAINYLVQVGVGGLFLIRENVAKIPKKDDMPQEFDSAMVESE